MKRLALPFALDSQLAHAWALKRSSIHAACVWVYTVSKVLPCSLTAPGGWGAGLTTADLLAPLQGKISYQAAAALCPAVWGLCQGFLNKCTGVHQAAGGKQRWRWERGEVKPLGHPQCCHTSPKKTGRHLSKPSSKITFKPPKWDTLSCVLWPNGGSVAMDTAASKGQYQVFLIRLETGSWQALRVCNDSDSHVIQHNLQNCIIQYKSSKTHVQ